MVGQPACLRFPQSFFARSLPVWMRGDSLVMMLHGYIDESYREAPDTSPIYVVAGYLAEVASWVEFEERWRESSHRLGIESIGLHASNCQRGQKPYDDMDEGKRREIVRQMVADIDSSKLRGVIAAIDTPALRRYEEIIAAFWSQPAKKYHRPHIYATDLCVHSMFLATEESKEPITFFADRNKEFESRCHEWYLARSCDVSTPFHYRYGNYSAGDRMKNVGLQTADLLAYSALRNLTGHDGWSWPEMTSGSIPLARVVADDDFWRTFSGSLGDRVTPA